MKTLLILTAAALVLAASASAGSKLVYRSDHQAEQYLENKLARWDGVNLRASRFTQAFCVNGYYSHREQRTGKHFQGRMSSHGEPLFHTFACTLSAGGRSWSLYLVAQPYGRWLVRADL